MREPAFDGGFGTAFDVFLPLKARLAQMDVHIDEPREDGEPAPIDALAFDVFGDLCDAPLFNAEVGAAHAVGQNTSCVFEDHISSLVSKKSMDILTAMPESTCSSMRLVSPSMSPLVSSTPRLTGPGCMTRAPFFAYFMSASLTP